MSEADKLSGLVCSASRQPRTAQDRAGQTGASQDDHLLRRSASVRFGTPLSSEAVYCPRGRRSGRMSLNVFERSWRDSRTDGLANSPDSDHLSRLRWTHRPSPRLTQFVSVLRLAWAV